MWGIHLTQVATRCCGRAKASTKKRIPRLLLWRGVGLRSASDSRSCRPKAATAMNSRVGRLGGHSHDARNLTFLFRSREATTHRVYLNEVDTPLVDYYVTVSNIVSQCRGPAPVPGLSLDVTPGERSRVAPSVAGNSRGHRMLFLTLVHKGPAPNLALRGTRNAMCRRFARNRHVSR